MSLSASAASAAVPKSLARPLPPEMIEPEAVLKEQAERSLAEYVKQAWPLIETTPYIHNWHIDVISEHLMAAAAGELDGRILLINVPFRTSKSKIVSVFFPTWNWARNPDPKGAGHNLPVEPGTWRGPGVKFLCTSHRQDMIVRDAVTGRRLLDSDWYQRRWGGRVSFTQDQNQKQRYENTTGGYRLSVPMSGMLGEGGDILLGDDLIEREQAHSEPVRQGVNDFIDGTWMTRFTDPKRTVWILIMQRLNAKDPAGHILANFDNVVHVMLPMEYEPLRRCYSPVRTSISRETIKGRYIRSATRWIAEGEPVRDIEADEWRKAPVQLVHACDPRVRANELMDPHRFPREQVDQIKKTLGSYNASGQMQQRPAPRQGGMFERVWFTIVPAAPANLKAVLRRWDLAGTAVSVNNSDPDWSAGCLMGKSADNQFFILNVTRFREGPMQTEHNVRNIASQDASRYGKRVQIVLNKDPAQAGKWQAEYLVRQLAGFNVKAVAETASKEARAEPLAAQVAGKNVFLVDGPWVEAFLDEICVVAGTLIVTNRGVRPIEDISLGEMVLTHKGRFRPVLVKSERAAIGLVQLEPKSLDAITLTPNHPVHALDVATTYRVLSQEWVNAGDILPRRYKPVTRAGRSYEEAMPCRHHAMTLPIVRPETVLTEIDLRDWLNPPAKNSYDLLDDGEFVKLRHGKTQAVRLNQVLDYPFGRLVGLYLAEGSGRRAAVCWSFNAKERHLIDEVTSFVTERFGCGAWERTQNNGTTVHAALSLVQDFFEEMGHGAANKRVPPWVWDAPDDFVRGLLSGYMEGDGYDSGNGKCRASTVSPSLAWGIRLLAARIGLHATVRMIKPAGTATILPGRVSKTKAVYIVGWNTRRQASCAIESDSVLGYSVMRRTDLPEKKASVFNLEVAEDNSYCTTAGLVHNCNFPNADHDDQVDAASGAFEELTSKVDPFVGTLGGI